MRTVQLNDIDLERTGDVWSGGMAGDKEEEEEVDPLSLCQGRGITLSNKGALSLPSKLRTNQSSSR